MDENNIYHPSKLVRVERFITSFLKTGDDGIVSEINVDDVPLETLLTIVVAKDDDPLLYDAYQLDYIQLDKINEVLPQKQSFDLARYDYQLECAGIYEYMLKEKP